MSGRKQFDQDKVLDAAMTVFWEQGYSAASLSDLESATGLNKSSIYNSYKSKERLFANCLQRFSDKYAGRALAALEHPDFRTAIRGFFEQLLNTYNDPDLPNGCLFTAATLELGEKEGTELADLICTGMESMRLRFEERCRQALDDGQLKAGTDCEALAAMILSMSRGIAVLNRGYGDINVARQAVEGMLSTML